MKLNSDMSFPKVIIVAPVSDRHKHLLDEWLDHLDKLNYPNFDVLLVDTTPKTDSYFNLLKTKKVKGKNIITWRHEWLPEKEYALQMLAHVREEIRKYFVEHKEYSHLFHLDDDIFIKKDYIQKLLSYRKDIVGPYVHVYYKPNRRPCVFKSGEIVIGKGLEYYTFAEIKKYKEFADKFVKKELTTEEKKMIPFMIKDIWHPHLFTAYAVNLGVLMTSRKVMEATQFRTHPTFLMGEDLWWYAEANDKGFTFWCDSNCRPIHKNTSWQSVNDLDLRFKGKMGVIVAVGPDKAEGIVVTDRDKNMIKTLKSKGVKIDDKK